MTKFDYARFRNPRHRGRLTKVERRVLKNQFLALQTQTRTEQVFLAGYPERKLNAAVAWATS